MNTKQLNLQEDTSPELSQENRNMMYKRGQRVTLIALISNISLCLFKLFAGFWGHSTAMVADGFHSMSDVLATAVVYLGLHIASKPSDRDHPYGHGKAESLVSLVVAAFLVLAGISIGRTAIVSIINGELSSPGWIAFAAALVSILVQETMFRISMYVGKAINSESLQANAWHHRSDALSSVGTLIGIGGALIGPAVGLNWMLYLDPIAGLIVSIIILKVAIDIFRKSVYTLMDGSADKAIMEAIHSVICQTYPEGEVEEIKAHYSGPDLRIDLILQVPDNYTVLHGHEIAEHVSSALRQDIPHVSDVMVHVHPKHDTVKERSL